MKFSKNFHTSPSGEEIIGLIAARSPLPWQKAIPAGIFKII
jgi:hypothetical protein